MWKLARKILMHDRVKFLVAGAGVSVSVLLILVQVGLYLGFMQNASNLIDHAQADIWVAGEGNENFDFAAPMDEQVYYRVAETPGVARAERMLLAFGQWRLPNGGQQGVQMVGIQHDARLLYPWKMVGGDPRRMSETNGIVLDRSEFPKLLLTRGIGERQEIGGVRSEVVGITEGIRSFTTSPLVFTNLDSARAYTRLDARHITYVMVKLEPGADAAAVKAALAAIPHVDAYTKAEFSARARHYWSSRTGVGAGFFTTAIMGIIVGLVVVGQILYNGTLEHLREYGTLKAMGARNGAIVRVILYQALFSAVVGYVLGGGLAYGAQAAMKAANLSVVLSPPLLAGTAVLTAVMCAAASLLSINKVLRLDPATVFKG